jgi:hypothetical protein
MSSDFGLNKFVLAFKPELVMGVSLYPGSLRSNQCNSGGVGILHFDDYDNDRVLILQSFATWNFFIANSKCICRIP